MATDTKPSFSERLDRKQVEFFKLRPGGKRRWGITQVIGGYGFAIHLGAVVWVCLVSDRPTPTK